MRKGILEIVNAHLGNSRNGATPHEETSYLRRAVRLIAEELSQPELEAPPTTNEILDHRCEGRLAEVRAAGIKEGRNDALNRITSSLSEILSPYAIVRIRSLLK